MIKLVEGGYYLDRAGEHHGPIRKASFLGFIISEDIMSGYANKYPWCDQNGLLYSENGLWRGSGGNNNKDLVQEIVVPSEMHKDLYSDRASCVPVNPVLEIDQILKRIKALEDQVRGTNGIDHACKWAGKKFHLMETAIEQLRADVEGLLGSHNAMKSSLKSLEEIMRSGLAPSNKRDAVGPADIARLHQRVNTLRIDWSNSSREMRVDINELKESSDWAKRKLVELTTTSEERKI